MFQTRKRAHEGQIAVLEQRIEQLQALYESKTLLAESFAEELTEVQALLKERFAEKQRLREVERSYASTSGEAAAAEIQIGETRLQVIQTNNQFQNEVAAQLAETQTEIKDVRERITALEDVVNRTEVRAPVAGVVNGMQVHTEGGVIDSGLPIAEIVPVDDELIIEAQISPADIDRVAVGQEAAVHFSNFGQSAALVTTGRVLTVSADILTSQADAGVPYYLARIELTPESMAELEGVTLQAGMPAEVYINSGSRTFLQYITKPLASGLARSLRED